MWAGSPPGCWARHLGCCCRVRALCVQHWHCHWYWPCHGSTWCLSRACNTGEGLLGKAPPVLLPCACRCAFSTGTGTGADLVTAVLGSSRLHVMQRRDCWARHIGCCCRVCVSVCVQHWHCHWYWPCHDSTCFFSLACDAAEGLLGKAPRVLLPCVCRYACSTGTTTGTGLVTAVLGSSRLHVMQRRGCWARHLGCCCRVCVGMRAALALPLGLALSRQYLVPLACM